VGGVAGVEGYVRDAAVGRLEQNGGRFQAEAADVLVNALADQGLEDAMEMER
jgi:hypothetical protein